MTIVQVNVLALVKVVKVVAMGLAPQAVDKVDVVLVKVLQLEIAEAEVALVAQVDVLAAAEDAEADVLVVVGLAQALVQAAVKVDVLLVEDVQDAQEHVYTNVIQDVKLKLKLITIM